MSIAVLLVAALAPAAQIHLDAGVGPCARLVPTPFRDTRTWLPGIALELSAVVPGDLARSKAPKSARGFIDPRGEVRVRPWWLSVLPREVLIAPGDSISAFGARWSLLGLDGGVALGKPAALRAGLDLLSVDWTHLDGPAFLRTRDIWSFGCAGKATLLLFPSSPVSLEAGWIQQLGVPTGAWEGEDRRSLPWTSGTARLLLHGRIPLSVRL